VKFSDVVRVAFQQTVRYGWLPTESKENPA